MADFQTQVLDAVAQAIGGTADPTDPSFFSGMKAGGDGTGVTGLVGCFSSAPRTVDATPLGIVLMDRGGAELASQGDEDDIDYIRLLILVAEYEAEWQMRLLAPFRDLVPAAMRAHMQIFSAPSAMDAFVTGYQAGIHDWAASRYMSIEFTIRVRRSLTVTLTP